MENTIKDFKDEFRLKCTDTFGDAVDAWYECLGHMYERGMYINPIYQFEAPSLGDVTEKDSDFYEFFKSQNDTNLKELSTYLYRYIRYLRYTDVDKYE